MKRNLSLKVEPMSRAKIKSIARNVRDLFKIKEPRIDMEQLIENLIVMGIVVVCEEGDPRLENKYALTYPDQNLILLSEETYLKACDHIGRDRFTVAHEIGHLFLHKGQYSLARSTTGTHKIYEDSEWQADTFASHFLIDDRYLESYSDDEISESLISEKFGTSYQAAYVYIQKNYN